MRVDRTSARCVLASSAHGTALYTFELEMPRIILAELSKHRALSITVESSRAVPFRAMAEKVRKQMFIPVMTQSQPGMQGYCTMQDPMLTDDWKQAGYNAIAAAEELHKAGVHKQVYNRLVENFTYCKAVVSGTEWDNFFNLRIHHAAEPHIRNLAIKIYEAMQEADVMELGGHDWHVPYIPRSMVPGVGLVYRHPETLEQLGFSDAIKLSVSLIAQTSYRTVDYSMEKANRIFNTCFKGDILHSVLAEHIARPSEDITDVSRQGNFTMWDQYRKTLSKECCWNFTDEMFQERIADINLKFGGNHG